MQKQYFSFFLFISLIYSFFKKKKSIAYYLHKMGNVTSQDKSKEIKKDYLSRRKYTFKKPQQSSQQASPNSILLETSSNASVSKNMSDISPNPAIEDMKLCAQRILSKSSSVSEISAQYTKSNAIKDERSILSLESRRKIVQRFNYKCCLPIEETMADYLLNAVSFFFFSSIDGIF